MRERFAAVRRIAQLNKGLIKIPGLSEGRTAPLLSVAAKERRGPVLVITSSQGRAKRLWEDLSFFLGEEKPLLLAPEEERVFLNYDARSRTYLEESLKTMTALASGEPCVVVASVHAALRKQMPKEVFLKWVFEIRPDSVFDLQELQQRLHLLGYERSPAIESRGQYSLRGDILDLFPYDRDYPVRAEFFDDTVDSLREFDPESQRSRGNLSSVTVWPARQLLYPEELGEEVAGRILSRAAEQAEKLTEEAANRLKERTGLLAEHILTGTNPQGLARYLPWFYEDCRNLTDYLPEEGAVIIEDYDRCRENVILREKERREEFAHLLEKGDALPEDFAFYTRQEELAEMVQEPAHLTIVCTAFTGKIKDLGAEAQTLEVRSRAVPVYASRMETFLEDVRSLKKKGYEVNLVCASRERQENLREFLTRNDVFADHILEGDLSAGSEFPDEKVIWISDADIFEKTRTRKRRKNKRKNAEPIKSFVDIRQGDYVVHENHGIGKFLEIRQLDVEGYKRDYLMIQYAGRDVLYVPVDQMDSVQKYIGGDGVTVRVNKLSGSEWKKAKENVRTSIERMAREIMELTAQRRAIAGFAFSQDGLWQKEFEDAFPYVETDDQLRSIAEVKKDMERPFPMERLLCGDVGYGKTEVAARAVFKCIADGKQAAILVPTTILANQHYHTFLERMENFPFNVEMLSRFRTPGQQAEIVKKLAEGKIDVIIGTHRLLSKDIAFRDLGLLIIDEEQRFGVRHKEALKMMRKNVDVLTLSATPIPRTLHLSLTGARDMSTIEEPPEERYPVQTYVMEEDEDIIKSALLSELDRGGQSFVVYNRVRDIRRVEEKIRELVPQARVAVGHGKMSEETLENVIIDFAEQRTDILVCTTIIETGIDMPNANTMIVLDADRFGLSQLYQLRGRVGRSTRIAYAYLMYRRNKVLTEVSETRLAAIRDFTELGAGFKIAMRDLELRGAGNLLGTEQSGHMVTVGYELYCKMLDETLRTLKGEPLPEEDREVSIELNVSAYLPEDYIPDETQRIELYQKIASVRSEEDRPEIMDELIDRFGDPPPAAENLVTVALIKAEAKRLGAERISDGGNTVTVHFPDQDCMTPAVIGGAVRALGEKVRFRAGRKPGVTCRIENLRRKPEEVLALLRSMTEAEDGEQ